MSRCDVIKNIKKNKNELQPSHRRPIEEETVFPLCAKPHFMYSVNQDLGS